MIDYKQSFTNAVDKLYKAISPRKSFSHAVMRRAKELEKSNKDVSSLLAIGAGYISSSGGYSEENLARFLESPILETFNSVPAVTDTTVTELKAIASRLEL